MLTPAEKDQLKNRAVLDTKVRANLYYRIAKKIKSNLSELDDINLALHVIPEKNARRVLNDEIITSILRLTENMIRILGYSPVEKGPIGQLFVCASKEMPSKDRNSQKFIVERRPPVPRDVARSLTLEKHIKRLQEFACPAANVPLTGSLAELPNLNSQIGNEGYELYKQWQDRVDKIFGSEG